MAEEAIEGPGRQWTSYRLVTVIVSVLILATQAIANIYYLQRWKEIEYLMQERNRKQEELRRQEEIPQVQLTINTLGKVGLSTEMLRSLTAIPSTVEIKHFRGGTAKGLLLDISSSQPIIQFQKWQSLEEFTVKRLPNVTNRLRLEAPQLRKGSTIGITLLTREIPAIDAKLVLETGELQEPSKEISAKSAVAHYLAIGPEEIANLTSRSVPGLSRSTLPLEAEIAILDRQIKALRAETLWSWITNHITAPAILLVALVLTLGSIIAGTAVTTMSDIRSDRRERSRRDEIVASIKKGAFEPSTLHEVLVNLGTPTRLNVHQQAGETEIELVYFGRYHHPSRRNYGIRFYFRNYQIARIVGKDDQPLLAV